jgi:hypothetical protein
MRVSLNKILTALGVAVVSTAGAQTPARVLVRVTARDSSGAPVPNAELTLTRGLHEVVGRGRTDTTGVGVLALPSREDDDYQVTMRKIGYPRGDRFFDLTTRDTTDVAITVGVPLANTLATVKVTANADLRRKSYHLDADDIESSSWDLEDGWDVVKRLRPDMLTSRGGCATGAQEIWVNGKHIRLPLMPTGMAAATARVGVPPRARFTYAAVSVLSEIAPEHIQEINYRDCFDQVPAVGMENAIFVVLKPGVVYKQDVGSFVLDTPVHSATKP